MILLITPAGGMWLGTGVAWGVCPLYGARHLAGESVAGRSSDG
jgi:hypothetical protein